tara:strand:- start:95 stop:244 length:150 start_codon:yes stop_codon:yes gene_type:complete
MSKKNNIVKEKTDREISEEFVHTLKIYIAVFLTSFLIIGMFVGFLVLYS